MRKLFNLLEIVILTYLSVVLYYLPEKIWYQGAWIYGVFGLIEILYFSSENKNIYQSEKKYLIETRTNVLTLDNIIVIGLVIIFIILAIRKWNIIKQNQVQIVWFSLIIGVKNMLYTRQKRCLAVDNEKISFNEIFTRNIYLSDIEHCTIDLKQNKINIFSKDQRKIIIRVKEDTSNDNINNIMKLLNTGEKSKLITNTD